MNASQLIVNINSHQPEELKRFYREVVGLPPHPDPNRESTFVAGGTEIVIDSHSEVKSQSAQPQRILLNFFVEDIAREQQRLEDAGVEFIRKQGREYWGGVISTFRDPDGNFLQLIEFRP